MHVFLHKLRWFSLPTGLGTALPRDNEIKPKMLWPLGPLGSVGWQDSLQMLLEGSRLGTALPSCPSACQEAEHR